MRQKTKRIQLIVVVILSVIASDTPANAGFLHDGAANPTTEGWTFFNSPGGTATVGAGAEFPPYTPYWEIDATGANQSAFYFVDSSSTGFTTAITDPLGWTYKVRAKVAQGYTNTATFFNNLANAPSFLVRDGSDQWGFHLVTTNALGPGGPANVAGAYYQDQSDPVFPNLVLLQELDISLFHDYELQMNRNGAGSADDTVSFLIDGALVTTLGRDDVLNTSTSRVLFGDGSSFVGGSITRYNRAEFYGASNPPTSPVPEPSSMALLGIGLFGGALIAFRRRRSAKQWVAT